MNVLRWFKRFRKIVPIDYAPCNHPLNVHETVDGRRIPIMIASESNGFGGRLSAVVWCPTCGWVKITDEEYNRLKAKYVQTNSSRSNK